MTKQEIELLENFKALEQLLNKRYNTYHGVTFYLDEMKKHEKVFNKNPGYKNDFYHLKRLRHIRNFLTHESGRSDLTKDDLYFLKDFYKRTLKHNDPLSKLKNKNTTIRINKMLILIVLIIVVGILIWLTANY